MYPKPTHFSREVSFSTAFSGQLKFFSVTVNCILSADVVDPAIQ